MPFIAMNDEQNPIPMWKSNTFNFKLSSYVHDVELEILESNQKQIYFVWQTNHTPRVKKFANGKQSMERNQLSWLLPVIMRIQ